MICDHTHFFSTSMVISPNKLIPTLLDATLEQEREKKLIKISLEDHLALKIQVKPNGYFRNVRKVS